jgi:hypothetical protein
MRAILLYIFIYLILGIFFPILPFPVKNGWHGVGGEFCGIVYQPECDKDGIRFLTMSGIKIIIDNHAY